MVKKYVFLMIFALSITSVQYHSIRGAVLTGPHAEYKVTSFLSMATGFDCFKENQKYFWKARVASCAVSGAFAKLNGLRYGDRQPVSYADVIAMDQCIWLFMTLICIILFSKIPFLMIAVTGIALQYAWLPMSEAQVNPWDAQSLFFWFIVLLVNNTKHRKMILFIIPVGALFKEIVAVLSILILFWDDVSVRDRLKLFLIIGFSCVGIKMIQGAIAGCPILGNQSFHYETKCRTGEYWIIHRNLNYFFKWSNFNPIWFSVTGIYTGLFLLPIHKKYRIIAIVYCCTVFIPGNITEGRLWHELIPVFLVGYETIRRAENGREYEKNDKAGKYVEKAQ